MTKQFSSWRQVDIVGERTIYVKDGSILQALVELSKAYNAYVWYIQSIDSKLTFKFIPGFGKKIQYSLPAAKRVASLYLKRLEQQKLEEQFQF